MFFCKLLFYVDYGKVKFVIIFMKSTKIGMYLQGSHAYFIQLLSEYGYHLLHKSASSRCSMREEDKTNLSYLILRVLNLLCPIESSDNLFGKCVMLDYTYA